MRIAGLALFAGAFAIAGCGPQAAQPSQQRPMDSVHGIMTKRVDPYADTIWGISNAARNDDAGIDPAKMSPEAWRDMASTAAKMEDAARSLRPLQPIRAVHQGERIVDEGNPLAPTAARVQKQIDADRQLFRAMARSLERHSRDLAIAARARDARTAGRLVNEIDGVCEGCHLQFWYPEDRKVWEELGKN